MKNLVIILIGLLFPLAISAKVDRSIRSSDSLKVVKIVPPDSEATINGNKVSVGGIISASSAISLRTKAKYITVYNLRTEVEHSFSSREFDAIASMKDAFSSIYNVYVKKNGTFSKGAGDDGIADMKRVLNNHFDMIEDEIFINSSLINDLTHYFELTTVLSNGTLITIPLLQNPDEPYTIFISKDYLWEYGIDVEEAPIRFAVTYITPDDEIPLTNYFYIEYIK